VRRLTILLAALGALMLVPAAGAFAAGTVTVVPLGESSGEVSSAGKGLPGSPPIECAYDGETEEASGECGPVDMTAGGGAEQLELGAAVAFGDEISQWVVEPSPFIAAKCSSPAFMECNLGDLEGTNNEYTVYAEFEPCQEGSKVPTCNHEIVVSKTGSGEGEITSEPKANQEIDEAAIDCGESCDGQFAPETEVALSANAEEGSEFTGWTGCESEAEGKCIVTMPEGLESKEVFEITANFDEEAPSGLPLTLEIKEGEGTVVSDPAGITCTGSAGEECTSEFAENEEVTLTASPAAGYRFFSWGLCPSANGRQCTVTMSEATEVRAKFKKTYDLTIDKGGSQRGVVLNSKNGVTCAVRCSTSTISLFEGAEVTIYTATPFGNTYMKEFTAGTGSTASCDGTAECTFTLEEDSSAEALFEERPKATLSIEKEGGGEAKLEGNGTFCNNSCESQQVEYFSAPTAQEAVIAWELNAGTSSIEWTTGAGTCTGSSEEAKGQCKVTMDEAHELVAKLE